MHSGKCHIAATSNIRLSNILSLRSPLTESQDHYQSRELNVVGTSNIQASPVFPPMPFFCTRVLFHIKLSNLHLLQSVATPQSVCVFLDLDT